MVVGQSEEAWLQNHPELEVALPRPTPSVQSGYDVELGPEVPLAFKNAQPSWGITAEDLDRNGDIELLVPGYSLIVLSSDGAGGWVSSEHPMEAPAPIVATGDPDQDGVVDVFWLGIFGPLQRFEWVAGNLELVEEIPYCDTCPRVPGPEKRMVGHLAFFDADLDGDDDLLISGATDAGSVFGYATRRATPYGLPNELWLWDAEASQFVRDVSFPVTRGVSLHVLTQPVEGGVEILSLNDYAAPMHARPTWNQPGSSARIVGGPGRWEETLFRDLGLGTMESPMGGVLADLDGNGREELVVSHHDAIQAYERDAAGRWWSVGQARGLPDAYAFGTPWSIVLVDPDRDGYPGVYVGLGNLPDAAIEEALREVPTRDLLYELDGSAFVQGSFPEVEGHTFGSTLADLDLDGRPEIVARDLPSANVDELVGVPTAPLRVYRERRAGGGLAELHFPVACPGNGVTIVVEATGRVKRFLPYEHLGSFGNGPTDRTSVGLGEHAESVITVVWPQGARVSLLATANRRVDVPCP